MRLYYICSWEIRWGGASSNKKPLSDTTDHLRSLLLLRLKYTWGSVLFRRNCIGDYS